MSDHARFAQVAPKKWANEQIARFFERIAHLLIFCTNDQFTQKTDERIPNPESISPPLPLPTYPTPPPKKKYIFFGLISSWIDKLFKMNTEQSL